VLLSNGDGTFQPIVTYDLGNYPATSMAVADVNGDGKADVVMTVSLSVSVLLGKGDGTFQPPVAYDPGGCVQVSPCANGVAVADVNGNGKLDLVVSNTYSGTVGILLGRGDGTFKTAVTYGAGGSGPGPISVGDLDGDGKLDIAVANMGDTPGTVGVLLGNGNGTFRQAVSYVSGGWQVSGLAVADVNGDGKPDVLVSNCAQGDTCNGVNEGLVGVLLGNGDGSFQQVVTYDSGGNGALSVALADVNGDGKPDLLAGNRCAGSCLETLIGGLDVLLGNGDGTFQVAETYSSGNAQPASIAVADLNGDGQPDVVAANINYFKGGTVGVLLHAGITPTATALTSSSNPAEPGQTVTYTAAVTSQSGNTVTGTVAFWDGDKTIATVELINNQATYSTAYKSVSTHPMTATYSGNSDNAASMSTVLTEKIKRPPFPTTTAVATSGSPSFIGQSVTFTGTVTCGTRAIPDGELLTFYDGTTTLGSVALAGGTAAFTTSVLSVKTHIIKATYVGDANFKPSSGTVTQVVNKYTTTTSLRSSLNPSQFGQVVTFTAHVTSSGPALTGRVRFFDGTTGIGWATLNGSGVGRLTKSTLTVGTHPITVQYLGDAASAKSTSPVRNQVVQ
jgi:hypothetical protein